MSSLILCKSNTFFVVVVVVVVLFVCFLFVCFCLCVCLFSTSIKMCRTVGKDLQAK